jgi:catechol 2,3-dioxygenase-like lactoylglutathione lyase family enzyme
MSRLLTVIVAALVVGFSATSSSAQLLAAKDGPVVYGHHHLRVASVDAQKKFWVDTLGASMAKVGTGNLEVVRLPNVLIFMQAMAPTGGSKGTTVNHLGFSVPNLRATLDKLKTAGYPIVTTAEVTVSPTVTISNDIATNSASKASFAFVMAPDDLKVEFYEDTQQTLPVMLHHVHFFGQQNNEMRDWYAKTFGAKPREAPGFPAADLPGVFLHFSRADAPVVATRGRTVDHVGFEVKNLEAFCKNLEAQGITLNLAYRKVPALNIAIAFLTDPWGTYIELTEGLDQVP